MSAEPVKRSQYFNPPTTECPHSSRNHFEDWEEFHLPMARMHHAALHGRGVASGLAVSVQEAGTQIEVGPGVAVDGKGELIALSAAGQADIGIERPGEAGQQIDPPFRLGIAGRETGTHYLCIQFAQALRFAEGSCGKLEQTPLLRLLPTAGDPGPIEAGEAIVLAIVEVDADGHRDGAGSGRGAAAPPPAGRARARASCGSDGPARSADAVADAPAGRIGARDGGGLRLSVADAADAMILDREDGGRFSRLEVQADEARLAGNLEVLGSLGLASWRLRAGGSEADPTLDLQPPATIVPGGLAGWHHVPSGHASSRAMPMRSISPNPAAGSASARLRPIAPSRWSARRGALNVRDAAARMRSCSASMRLAAWSRP